MPEHGTPDLTEATKNLETALAAFQKALRANQTAALPRAPPGPVFQALRQWRTEQARAKQLPPYIIATDAALQAIEASHPTDLNQLGAVRGVGRTKALAYGPEILQIVATASATLPAGIVAAPISSALGAQE